MVRTALISALALMLSGCGFLAPQPVWTKDRPDPAIVVGAASYDWPASLVSDAIVDSIDRKGGAVQQVETTIARTRITFAGVDGRQIAEVVTVSPDKVTVYLMHPPGGHISAEAADDFFMMVELGLGLK
ncbi:MAG: hypothetical protein AAGA69_04170 [Pseudomonadota bacterium]